MEPEIYRFRFDPAVPMPAVHESLRLAICAAEAVHGRPQVRLSFGYCADDEQRSAVLDARTEAGGTVARIFTGLLTEHLGEQAFRVERVGAGTAVPAPPEDASS